jgi:hypothetical protein
MFSPKITKLLPYINFTVATAALTFQVTVLYPWHHLLEQELHQLKGEQNEKLLEFHRLKLERMNTIESKLDLLLNKRGQ